MDVSGGFDCYKPAIISAVIIMNITLTILVIAVIASYPQLREDRTTLFIFSLTLSDLANGCTALPISAAVCSNVTPNARNMLQYSRDRRNRQLSATARRSQDPVHFLTHAF